MDDISSSDTKYFHGGCPHDCPDTCSMVYEVQDGKLKGVKGNPDHPMTRGGLCVKLKDYEKRHYHPDRVLYPQRRIGPKGSMQFERITWDEALDEITEKWKAIIDEHGPQAIMPNSYLGNQGLVHGLNGGDSFFARLGATVTERTFCGEGSATAWLLTVGPTAGVDPESFIHSKYIIVWACNSVSTNLHHWHIIKEAQKKGAKVVVIDSYASRTAKEADWHIAPKPGTDGALAMAMMNVIIEEGLVDQDYIDNYTVGYPELAELAKKRTPEWAAEITGITSDDIRKFAREYSTSQPSAIRIGVALEKSWGGSQTIRAVTLGKTQDADGNTLSDAELKKKGYNVEMVKYYDEFLAEGGQTGYGYTQSLEEVKKDVDAIENPTNFKKFSKGLNNLIDSRMRSVPMAST